MITHAINYPVEVQESEPVDDDQQTVFELYYHRSFDVGVPVTVRIDDLIFHCTILGSDKVDNCYVVRVSVKEGFLLRNVEQIIRIKESHLQPEEWVNRYGADFPKG